MGFIIDAFSDSLEEEEFQFPRNRSLDLLVSPNNSLCLCDPSSSSSPGSVGNSPDSHDTTNTILKYIREILMEEDDLESKPCMLQDCLALKDAEKSLYEVLGQKYPPSCEDPCSPRDRQSDQENDSNGSIFLNSEANNCIPTMSPSPYQSMKEADAIGAKDGTELREKKYHQREYSDKSLEGGRNGKQQAIYGDDYESQETFDKVLFCSDKNYASMSCSADEFSETGRSEKSQPLRSIGKTSRSRRRDDNNSAMDLATLLTQCAQAVAIDDHRSASDLLKQIRNNSSAFGDGTQRLAHYFAIGLETRLAAGSLVHSPLACYEASAADILNAYHLFITACPFQRMSSFFTNRMILKLAEKTSSLHVIDFGILYGFQWPCLIKRLSIRSGGPPKLRITAIELPQPGFRPSERVEETGRRLNNYCKRFHVPFEYRVLAQKWETVKLQDLKVDKDDLTIVTCMYRLKNIPEETVVSPCPRDTVLRLIKQIDPDLFIHNVVNGMYNAPFFLTRFREALFHFSALFDMFEATVTREDPQRHVFEREIFGRDAVNVIACEGLERVERPETYKQWQARTMRAGFKQIPLDQEIFKAVKKMVKSEYHEDFDVDHDGHWMLQGWKGRILDALSCWIPA